MAHIGRPAAATPNSCRSSRHASSCVTRTLCDDAEKCNRQDHLCAVRLRQLPFVLLRLPPRCAASDTRLMILLAELEHLSSHQVGVTEAVRQ